MNIMICKIFTFFLFHGIFFLLEPPKVWKFSQFLKLMGSHPIINLELWEHEHVGILLSNILVADGLEIKPCTI